MESVEETTANWLFSREKLENNTPSRRAGVAAEMELSYRQAAARLIQHMGKRLAVTELTMNTAIVYMHRFYMVHSFTKFHGNSISQASLFLAAKVEEEPKKLEHIVQVAHACINRHDAPLDTRSDAYLQQAEELVVLETILLETLGFEITVEHPHLHVVKCSQLVRASKDLARTSYVLATNSLHHTTFCLQHKPLVVACVCIHLASRLSNWEIPLSTDGKHWWQYLDCAVTLQLLDKLTHEFLQVLEKMPGLLKQIIGNRRATEAAKKPGQSVETSPCTSTSSLDSSPPSTSDDAGMPSLDSMTAAHASCQPLEHAAELALHNGRTDEQGADMFVHVCPSLASSHDHKKRSRSQAASQPVDGGSSSKKSRMENNGPANSSEEGLKMSSVVKVSSTSQRHGGSLDQTGPPAIKEDKHKEHSGWQHRHSKNGHSHSHPYYVNRYGRCYSVTDPALSLRGATGGHGSDTGSYYGSSRKRAHPDAHHHSAKSPRSSRTRRA